MELGSYADYVFYMDVVKWMFVFIGFCAFLFYTFNTGLRPISPWVVLLVFIAMVVVLGLCPILNGSDRWIYMRDALRIDAGGSMGRVSDVGYYWLNKFLVLFPTDWFLYLHSLLYVLGIYYFARSVSWEQAGLMFLVMLLNFQFVAYGINTMRAGLAGSALLVAMANRDRRTLEWVFLVCAVLIHKSFALPALCYVIAKRFDRTDIFFCIWLIAIPVSAFAGTFFQDLLGSFLGFDERMSYLTTDAAHTHYKVGFRVDFILFSSFPILVCGYMIYRLKFEDYFYKVLFNTYLLANTFWILVIRANFSDRFAYLSWFIYCPLLIYPVVKQPDLLARPHKWIAYMILWLVVFKTVF